MLIGGVGLQLVFAAPGGAPVMDFSCPGLQWVQEAAVGCGALFLVYFSLLIPRRRPRCCAHPQGGEVSGHAAAGQKSWRGGRWGGNWVCTRVAGAKFQPCFASLRGFFLPLNRRSHP